jgi:protoporphyrinogen/coproporphyrinogen III oxidase
VTTHVPVLVIGAGISGLVCGYALRKAGVGAQIVEASARTGGVIRSERRDGYLLELGPQSFLGTPQLLELCRELGIEDQLLTAPRRAPRFLLVNSKLGGKLRPAPLSPAAFLASSLFSMRTKWSVLRDLLGRSAPPDVDESVGDFVRRKFSSELLDKLVGPFASGIYAGDAEKLSLRASFPQLHEAERSAGSLIRGMIRAAKSARATGGARRRPTLQSFRDGNETLTAALTAKLGSAVCTSAEVIEIRRDSSDLAGYTVVLKAGDLPQQISASKMIFATPAKAAAGLLRPLDRELATALDSVEYAPVAVVSLGYTKSAVRHALNGFGFLVPRSSGLRTLGTVWNSSLLAGRAPGGYALLTSFVGGATDPQAAALAAEQLVSLVHQEIAPVLGLSQKPSFSNVTVYHRALPQYNLGHTERVAALDQLRRAHSGLWFVGNYLSGPSIGACVEQALAVADEIHARETAGADRSP